MGKENNIEGLPQFLKEKLRIGVNLQRLLLLIVLVQ